jgi:hypothetical protein
MKSVCKCAATWLDSEIELSVHLYLLHGHLEPVKDKPPKKVIMSFRHYLEVPIPKHCLALTRLHPLAVEQLRRASRYHPLFATFAGCANKRWRLLSMFCSSGLCDNFCMALQPHGLHFPVLTLVNAAPMLQNILYNRSSVNLLARFVYDALAIVQLERTPLYRSQHILLGGVSPLMFCSCTILQIYLLKNLRSSARKRWLQATRQFPQWDHAGIKSRKGVAEVPEAVMASSVSLIMIDENRDNNSSLCKRSFLHPA